MHADRAELDALKARVDLAELFRQSGIPLRKLGRNLVAPCWMHEDTEASLVVNPERQLWNCLGACQTGGDALTFLELREGLTFPQAVERLRALAGELPAPPPGNGRTRAGGPEELPGGFSRPELLGRVAAHYASRLAASAAAREALAARGLDDAGLWEAFGIGYADGSLLEALPKEGELRRALGHLGVLTQKGTEHFSGCLVVPLHHPDRGVVGLCGRRITPRARVRHLYLPGPRQGVLNHQVLRTASSVVLAEGVLDALALIRAGVGEATALFGTQGLPPDLEELLGRYGVREVRLCLDADPAGQRAAPRLASTLAARGIRCLRVELPEGQDPNEVLVEAGPEALRTAVRQAVPVEVPAGRNGKAGPALEETEDGFRLHCGELVYRVTPRPPFGGRLRVTLRATRGEAHHLDTLDLYTHRARAAAVNQVAARLEVPKPDVERHMLALVEQAERWVAAFLEAAGDDPETMAAKPVEMTPEERAEALELLRRPDLVRAILDDMEALGTVGEEKGKLLAYLIGVSRKLDRPLAGIILSQSGAGKSGLAAVVEQLTPPEEAVLYSRLSAQALGYMPKDFLKHKLVVIEERVGAEAAEYHLRVLCSRQKLSQAVAVTDPATGRTRTKHFEVEGPIALLETTTASSRDINQENATRCFEIGLDESEEQTRRIHARQRQARSPEGLRRRRETEAIRRRHHQAQRLLERVAVAIPFVELLDFPSRWLRTRRDHERFLCLVEVSAFLHQHQRVRRVLRTDAGEEVPYVEATPADYRLAYELARDVLGMTLHELSRAARELWDELPGFVAGQAGGGDPAEIRFTRRVLRQHTGWRDYRLREALQELVEMEYVGVLAGGSQGRTYEYRLLVFEEQAAAPLGGLTTPEQLERLLRERRDADPD